MIDVLPRSHAAIFARPQKKLPPSLILAIMVAAGLHALVLFYLVTQNFAQAVIQEAPATPAPPVTVTMEKQPVEHAKAQPPSVIHAHPPVITTTTPPETTNIIPVKGPDIIASNQPPVIPTSEPNLIDTSGTQTGPVYVTPRWTSFPDSGALAEYYPGKAIDDNRTGQAQVECTVLDAAGHISCVLLSETPAGYGFGDATVRVVQDKGRIDTDQGVIKPGSKLRATLKWELADG